MLNELPTALNTICSRKSVAVKCFLSGGWLSGFYLTHIILTFYVMVRVELSGSRLQEK